jgi:hypothetical protein
MAPNDETAVRFVRARTTPSPMLFSLSHPAPLKNFSEPNQPLPVRKPTRSPSIGDIPLPRARRRRVGRASPQSRDWPSPCRSDDRNCIWHRVPTTFACPAIQSLTSHLWPKWPSVQARDRWGRQDRHRDSESESGRRCSLWPSGPSDLLFARQIYAAVSGGFLPTAWETLRSPLAPAPLSKKRPRRPLLTN